MSTNLPTLALGTDSMTIIIGMVCIILVMWLIELCVQFFR